MASEEFLSSFGRGGTIRCTCSACGVEYFASDDGFDFEEGELEALQKRAEENPEKCIDTVYSVGTIFLAGNTFPYECKCGAVDKYENFIRSHRREIAQYLRKVANKKLMEAMGHVDDAVAIEDANERLDEHSEDEDAA